MARQARPGLDGVLDGVGNKALYSALRHPHGRPVVAIYTLDGGGVRAGHFLYVEPDVELMIGGNHRIDWVTTFPVREIYDLPGARVGIPWSKGDIVIGNGVRLGRGARVMSGVSIGDCAYVAPYSVVVHHVRPYSVVAGNPAREVGLRFDADIVERLSGAAWWDWHEDMTIWRLDRLTRGRAHTLAPQLGRDGPITRPARARRLAAHVLRGLAHHLDAAGAPDVGPPTAVEPPPHDEPAAAAPTAGPPPVTLAMGCGSYGWPTVHGPTDRVTIASYCSIAPSTIVVDGLDDPTPSGARRRGPTGGVTDVHIGNDVWVGRGACILPGVTVGDGAVIAAYAVVASDIRPFAVVAGNPAREVKRRFDDSTVDALLRIRWWEWPEAVVKERAQDLCSEDIGGFIARYGSQPIAGRLGSLRPADHET